MQQPQQGQSVTHDEDECDNEETHKQKKAETPGMTPKGVNIQVYIDTHKLRLRGKTIDSPKTGNFVTIKEWGARISAPLPQFKLRTIN